MTNRADILAEFAMEETIDHSTLKTYISKYPEVADDLLDLFNECVIADLETEEASIQLETKSVASMADGTQTATEALYGVGMKELARELELPRAFFVGLHSGCVQLSSMPAKFVKNIAQATKTKTHEVMEAMQLGYGQSLAYKSDQKPQSADAMPFSDYVDQANLSTEEQAALRRLIDGDGSR